ncbi:hypothetical protein STAS_31649 [Striga asiatica]|uniref:Uncharacterized protein n=1 Tax=Striga asiatica TaxID=4170 RepID=A0A5A7R9F6_STRAF|nr:hypothetical protein STAS_31649 [Striga asiatica]
MKDYEIEEKKQAAADVLFQYSKFALACLGNQVRPCDLRMHLMKEISGLPTSLKKASSHATAAAPDIMGESSSSGIARLDKIDTQSILTIHPHLSSAVPLWIPKSSEYSFFDTSWPLCLLPVALVSDTSHRDNPNSCPVMKKYLEYEDVTRRDLFNVSFIRRIQVQDIREPSLPSSTYGFQDLHRTTTLTIC